MKIQFNLASLPTVEGAAKQHSFRAYLQINISNRRVMNLTDWGWMSFKHAILLITTNDIAALPELLNTLSCECAKGCKYSLCSC